MFNNLKNKLFSIIVAILILLGNANPATATQGYIQIIEIRRTLDGSTATIRVYDDGTWENRTINYDPGTEIRVYVYTATNGGGSPFYYQLQSNCGYYDDINASNYYYTFYSSPLGECDYTATVDGYSVGPFYLRTAGSTVASGDVYEPDNTYTQARAIAVGSQQTRTIYPVGDEDWIEFTLSEPANVTIETSGLSGDTRMWLYASDGTTQIAYNDDGGTGYFSLITAEGLEVGTYYIRIDEFGDNDIIDSYYLDLTVESIANIVFSINANDIFFNDSDLTEADGDGVPESGEDDIYTDIEICNFGNFTASNIEAVITEQPTEFPDLWRNADAYYPDIAPGQCAYADGTPFRIDDIPLTFSGPLLQTLTIYYGTNQEFSQDIIFTISIQPTPRIRVLDGSYNFGIVPSGTLVEHDFIVQNIGSETATISSISTSHSDLNFPNHPATIPAGEARTFTAEFDTTEIDASVVRTFTINSDAHLLSTNTGRLSGTVRLNFDQLNLELIQTYLLDSVEEVVTGDTDGDGKVEIIVSQFVYSDIDPHAVILHMYEQTAPNTFEKVWDSSNVHMNPRTGFDTVGLAIGDVTGDGKDDIVYASGYGQETPPNKLHLFTSNGDNSLALAWSTDLKSRAVAIGDADNDGYMDVVTTTPADDSKVLVYEWNGSGLTLRWSSPTIYEEFSLPNPLFPDEPYQDPMDLCGTSIADTDNDGNSEIIVGSEYGYMIIFEKTGNNIYTQRWKTRIKPTSSWGDPCYTAVGDLDGDTYPEIGYVDDDDEYMVVVETSGNDSWSVVWSEPVTPTREPTYLLTSDLDLDGKGEWLIGTNEGSVDPNFIVYEAFNNNSYATIWESPSTTGVNDDVSGIATLNSNENPQLEIVVSSRYDDAFYLYGIPVDLSIYDLNFYEYPIYSNMPMRGSVTVTNHSSIEITDVEVIFDFSVSGCIGILLHDPVYIPIILAGQDVTIEFEEYLCGDASEVLVSVEVDPSNQITETNESNNTISSGYQPVFPDPDENLLIVSKIDRVGSSPTDAAIVDFRVVFSEPVTGVDIDDFTLYSPELSDTFISAIRGSGNTYFVTVTTGSGDGTIRLDLVDDDSIINIDNEPLGGAGAGNGNFSWGEEYQVVGVSPCSEARSVISDKTFKDLLSSSGDINVYKFQVDDLYTDIVATLTPQGVGDFDIALFGACEGEVSNPWDIGRRAWHIGRRAWHIGSEDEANIYVRYNVGEKINLETGVTIDTYYLVVRTPDGGEYNGNSYQLNIELKKPNFSVKDTLILYNPTRFKALFPEEERLERASEMMHMLTLLAEHEMVNGVILQLDQFDEVNAAYADWDDPVNEVIHGDSTSYQNNVLAANHVTEKIRAAMKTFFDGTGETYIRDYVVIVGDDHQIPFRRVEIGPDPVPPDYNWKKEDTYLTEILGEDANSPLDAALMLDLTLTDDYYGDYRNRYNERELPRYAVGRLQDTRERIEKMIYQFLDNDGRVNLTTTTIVTVAGDDFLTDAAEILCEKLTGVGLENRNCDLVGHPDGFSGEDLYQAFIVRPELEPGSEPKPEFAAHYYHSTHYHLLPTNDPPVTLKQLTAEQIRTSSYEQLPNSLWWALGCHSGLVLPESENYSLSIAQALADQGVTYIGNTGWAWGVDGPPGYSELLYNLIADELTNDGNIPIGEALIAAKKAYFDHPTDFATNDKYAYYDAKVVAQATLYGLPMTVFDFPEPVAEPISEELQSASISLSGMSGSEIQSASLPDQFHPWDLPTPDNMQQHLKSFGEYSYYVSSEGRYKVHPNAPIPPQSEVIDFQTSLGRGVDVMWLGGKYHVENVPNPLVIGQPTLTNDDPSPVGPTVSGIYPYPLLPVTLTGIEEWDEKTFSNHLVFQTGQYYKDQQGAILIRLFPKMNFLVGLWKGDTIDESAPEIGKLSVSKAENTIYFELPISELPISDDTQGIYRAYITYNDPDNQEWKFKKFNSEVGECAKGEHIYSIDVDLPVTGDLEYFIQVMDCAGNVSRMFDDGEYFKLSADTPLVSSIVRVDSSPTSARSVDFEVSFSRAVTGVDESDFVLSSSGLTGAYIIDVQPASGAAETYTVTVDTGSGISGTVRLDLVDNDSIVDTSSIPIPLGGLGLDNGAFTGREVYTIVRTNDDFEYASEVSTLRYQSTISTIGATSDVTDPPLPAKCNVNGSGLATVWYKYEPSTDSALAIDTNGSDYDTFLAIWEGTSVSDLRFVACNNDAIGTYQSSVAFQVQGGLTYYIEIGQP